MQWYKWCGVGLALALVLGCGANETDQLLDTPVAPAAESANTNAATTIVQASGQDTPMIELWSHSCALCHVDGNAGAPRMGNADEWAPRLAKGKAVLLQHTLEGLNQMPPLGYCMACERSDFVAMIEFMTRGIDAKPAEMAQ